MILLIRKIQQLISQIKVLLDSKVINWDIAYTHSQDNSQAHSDYMLNTGDVVSGNYTFNGVVTLGGYIDMQYYSIENCYTLIIRPDDNARTGVLFKNSGGEELAEIHFTFEDTPQNILQIYNKGTGLTIDSTGVVTVEKDILPDADLGNDLGASNKRFAQVWGNKFNDDGSNFTLTGRMKLLGSIRFNDGDTTPDVKGGNLFYTNNERATTITDFDNGSEGQILIINFRDNNTTLQDGINNLRLAGNFVGTVDDTIMLIYTNSLWLEISRSIN